MDIIPPPKRNIILDATLLSAIMNCGRYTDLRFNENLVPAEGKGNSLEVGSIMHTILEFYNKSLIEGHKRDLAIANGLAAGQLYIVGCAYCKDFEATDEAPKPKCNHQANQFPGVESTPPDNEGNLIGYNYVLKTAEEYFDYYRNDFWIPLEAEVVKGEILYEDDNIRILWKAKFDLIADSNNGIFPMDHKTMKQRKSTNDLNNQFMGQVILTKQRTIYINKIGWQTSLKPSEKFTRASISYTADRLLEWQSEILPSWAYRYLSYHESDNWEPNFSHCETKYSMCQYAEICRSDRSMRGELVKLNFIRTADWNPVNE